MRATPHGRRERKPVQRIAPRGGRGFFKVKGEDKGKARIESLVAIKGGFAGLRKRFNWAGAQGEGLVLRA
jgi:hypothetical protein